MQLNASPLNGVTLNGATQSVAAAPVDIVPARAYHWRLRALVGGEDLTDRLTGVVDVDREEGAAGVAGFSLYMPPGPVVPTDWQNKAVTIDFIVMYPDGESREARLFTGKLGLPTWDRQTRVLGCDCSDRRQQRVEAMATTDIDDLVDGDWSADVFEPVAGRSHWDYAQERLSTRPASLDCSASGDLRVTSWFAQAPHYRFGPGVPLDDSVQIELQDGEAVTNRVEIEVNYRYSRAYQQNQQWAWSHPNLGTGFCEWRIWSSDLPTTEMLVQAVEGAGMVLVGQILGNKLPLSAGDPCLDGQGWTNIYDNLWLGATVRAARRWVQTVTETYTLVLTTPGGEDDADTQVVSRDSTSFEVESDAADAWEEGTPAPDPVVQDFAAEERRVAALTCMLRRGQVELIDAHRGTTVSWQEPTEAVLDVDLVHTLQLSDLENAVGKCRRIQQRFDLDAGTAISTLSIAVMRGGGEGDPLVVPLAPATSLPALEVTTTVLPTQLGGRLNHPISHEPIPPFDEDMLGFAGNWDAKDDTTAEDFERRFKLSSLELDEAYRDEATGTTVATYRVAIPNDPLEL